MPDQTSDFTVVAVPGAFGAGVAITLDLLRAAAALAPRAGAAAPRWRLCSLAGGSVELQSGLRVETRPLPLRPRGDRSTWILPGLGLNTEHDVAAFTGRADSIELARRLRRHVLAGGRVAAACSAVFLLQRAGLLEGRRATTTWWLAPLLQRHSPGCRVDASRMVCVDGPVVTAGAAFAQTDLMIGLLRDACGAQLAELLCRFLLVDSRQAQAPYAVPEVMASGDELVTRIVERIERAMPEVPSVAELAAHFCVSSRTLARRVRRATGRSTLALVQSVKLRRARSLLANSRLSVEQVAAAVGYEDPTALRRLIRRTSGASPRQYRPVPAPQAPAAR